MAARAAASAGEEGNGVALPAASSAKEDERRRVEQAGFMILLHNAEHAGQGGKLLAGHFGGAPGDNDGTPALRAGGGVRPAVRRSRHWR